MNILLSIITPTFNCSNYIEQSILSVINQKHRTEFEYIIIDGKSNDGTVNIIKKYENQIDYWLSEADKGQADALNKAVRISKGKFILWLNGDDYLINGLIEKISDELKKLKEDETIYGDIISLDDTGKSYYTTYNCERINFKYLLNINPSILTNSTIYPRKLFYESGFFHEGLHYAFDYELYLRLVKKYKLVHLNIPFLVFRIHSESKSQKKPLKFDFERCKIRKMYGGKVFSLSMIYSIKRILAFYKRKLFF